MSLSLSLSLSLPPTDKASEALKDAQVARAIDPKMSKAWFREGQALAALKMWWVPGAEGEVKGSRG